MTLNRPAERLAAPRTMQCRLLRSGLYLCVHNEHTPDDLEWLAMVDELSQKADQIRGVLVYTVGGAPTARQRKQVGEMWARYVNNPPTAVIMRGFLLAVISALNWFLKNPIHAFPPSDLERALDFVKAHGEQRSELLQQLERICLQLRVPLPVETQRAAHAKF